jgi:alkylation response protein AidB-like acyl-CoA dehydrogenase
VEFKLTDDQAMLRDMADRLAAEQHGFEARRAAIASEDGRVPGFWDQVIELGLLGAALPEAMGGLGGGAVEIMLIQQAFGRHLVLSPYLSSALAGSLIAEAGTDAERAAHLPAILDGTRTVALALGDGNIVAHAAGEDYELHGAVPLVVAAPWCDRLLVTALLEGGTAVFLLPADTPGVTIDSFHTIDGGRAARIHLNGALVPAADRIGGDADLTPAIDRLGDRAAVALCAAACGSIEALLDATVAYAGTRKQFGQPIGKFQVLQHRMVDMLVAREQGLSITHAAALAQEKDCVTRQRATSAAKAQVGRLGRAVAQAAVQIHGGIGITEELNVSHHFRCIEMLDMQFGTADAHIRRYADLLDA